MSDKMFEKTHQVLVYTNVEAPNYKDRFWKVRKLISEWNKNMDEIFTPSWVSCLDESMSIWFNKWTCPGWMFVPRKPHPFGNEYHSVCCGQISIMWGIELVEGKDAPRQRARDPNETSLGKTGALLLRMLKPIFGTAKVVILDSGFCVLRALVALQKNGVFASSVIKKRMFWPALIPGDTIDAKMSEKPVETTESLRGQLEGVKYDVFCLKEPMYTMKLMSTYAGHVQPSFAYEMHRHYIELNYNEVNTSFNLQEPFANHYLNRHVVNDHNNGRHALPSIEDTWGTHRWANRVFAFILAISEVSTWLAFRYFVWKSDAMELVEFRKKLAFALINNEYLEDEVEEEVRKKSKFQLSIRLLEHRHIVASMRTGNGLKTVSNLIKITVTRPQNVKIVSGQCVVVTWEGGCAVITILCMLLT